MAGRERPEFSARHLLSASLIGSGDARVALSEHDLRGKARATARILSVILRRERDVPTRPKASVCFGDGSPSPGCCAGGESPPPVSSFLFSFLLRIERRVGPVCASVGCVGCVGWRGAGARGTGIQRLSTRRGRIFFRSDSR